MEIRRSFFALTLVSLIFVGLLALSIPVPGFARTHANQTCRVIGHRARMG